MAIFIKLHENKFGNEKLRGKWFAKIVRTGEIDIDEMAERIQRNTTFKTGEVRGILIELIEEMKKCLQEGNTVNLNGLGRFHLTIESNHVDNPKNFRTDHDIKSIKCKFKPMGHKCDDGRLEQVIAKGTKVKRWKE